MMRLTQKMWGQLGSERIVTCTHAENLDIIHLHDTFISHQYKLKKVSAMIMAAWDVKLTLHRENGRKNCLYF